MSVCRTTSFCIRVACVPSLVPEPGYHRQPSMLLTTSRRAWKISDRPCELQSYKKNKMSSWCCATQTASTFKMLCVFEDLSWCIPGVSTSHSVFFCIILKKYKGLDVIIRQRFFLSHMKQWSNWTLLISLKLLLTDVLLPFLCCFNLSLYWLCL